METMYIYLGGLISIVLVIALILSKKIKFSLNTKGIKFESTKPNSVLVNDVTNESEVKVKKGDNHDIKVDKIDGKSKVEIQ